MVPGEENRPQTPHPFQHYSERAFEMLLPKRLYQSTHNNGMRFKKNITTSEAIEWHTKQHSCNFLNLISDSEGGIASVPLGVMIPRRPCPPLSPCPRGLAWPSAFSFLHTGQSSPSALPHFLKDSFQARWRLFRQIPFPGVGDMLLTVQEKGPKCRPHSLPFSAPLRDGSVGGVGGAPTLPTSPSLVGVRPPRGAGGSVCLEGSPHLQVSPSSGERHSPVPYDVPAGCLPLSSGHQQCFQSKP